MCKERLGGVLRYYLPPVGKRIRMLMVLAYNSKPGMAISESASMTFYSQVGEITTKAG